MEHNQVEHTKQERTILQNLKHPFVSTLHFAFQTESKLYLGMTYYPGGSLFHFIQHHNHLSESIVLFYIAEAISGLIYLHNSNIIYRDLKPENILIQNTGHIVLTDFGLSKYQEMTKTNNTLCGKI